MAKINEIQGRKTSIYASSVKKQKKAKKQKSKQPPPKQKQTIKMKNLKRNKKCFNKNLNSVSKLHFFYY